MPTKPWLCLALLCATSGMASTSSFLLGMDYSEWLDPNALQLATDNSGALYILSTCTNAAFPLACVTKVSADGKTMLWRTQLGFLAYQMAVDPEGGSYVVRDIPSGKAANVFVEKLSGDGTVAWQTSLEVGVSASSPDRLVLLTVDSAGRALLAGYDDTQESGYLIRLNVAGTVAYTTSVNGLPSAIAVDATGADVVVGLGKSGLARITPERDTKVYSTAPRVTDWLTVAMAPNGDLLVYGSDPNGDWLLQRIDPAGTVQFANDISAPKSQYPGLAVDAEGNAYITGSSGSWMHPVRNSLAPCGSVWLSVFAPDGSILQTTYIPGAAKVGITPRLAVGPNSTVFLMASSATTFAPTQTGPFPPAPPSLPILAHLSPNPYARTLPLACVGNSASYDTGAIAPGGMVTLFGNGLGPRQGVQTEATLQKPFPTQASNVQVTFDGKPAPLLWVQDAQINAAVPWSLNGQTTQICVAYNDLKTNCLDWPVAPTAPGVFMVDGDYAAALNQDGTVNSADNPAPVGSVVSIFATGLGPVSPAQPDGSLVGLPLPVNAFPLELQGACPSIPCTGPNPLAYSGPAPFLIAGASQVNLLATSDTMNLAVTAPSTTAISNYFQVHVEGGGTNPAGH